MEFKSTTAKVYSIMLASSMNCNNMNVSFTIHFLHFVAFFFCSLFNVLINLMREFLTKFAQKRGLVNIFLTPHFILISQLHENT